MFSYNESLDFGGSFIDSQGPDIPVKTLKNIPNDDTVSTVNLQRLVDDPLRCFRGK